METLHVLPGFIKWGKYKRYQVYCSKQSKQAPLCCFFPRAGHKIRIEAWKTIHCLTANKWHGKFEILSCASLNDFRKVI